MINTTAPTFEVPAAMLRAALICASNEQVRYYLRGVYVDPKGYLVSTDGHRLFCGRIDLTDVPAFDGWIICRDALKRALTGWKAGTINIAPRLVGDVSCAPVDGTFPDWRRVVPETTDGTIAQFQPHYVGDLGKIASLLTDKKNGFAHIHHNGTGPAGVTFPGCADAYAVLMPIRSRHAASDWTARPRND